MQNIPVQPVASQTLTVLLDGQQVQISLRQVSTGLYIDLQSNGQEIVGLVICQNLNRVVRNRYFGFVGDLVFLDTTGAGQDPYYSGLGSRWVLVYLEEADLPAALQEE